MMNGASEMQHRAWSWGPNVECAPLTREQARANNSEQVHSCRRHIGCSNRASRKLAAAVAGPGGRPRLVWRPGKQRRAPRMARVHATSPTGGSPQDMQS